MIKQFMENGKTCFTVQAYGTTRTGQQVRRRRILRDVKRAAAVKLERELNYELQQLKQGFSFAGLTYEDFLIHHFYPYVDEQFPTEYESLKLTINKWAKPIMQLKLESINPTDIKEILDKAGETLANATVKKLRSSFHRCFEFAIQGGYGKPNPVASVKNSNKRQRETEPQILTRKEIQILLTEAKKHRPEWYKIWAFALFTGMRSGEMYALLRQDIDLENKLISVTKSFNKRVGIKSTKSGRNRRISVSEKIMPLVKELMVGPIHEPLLPRPYQWKKSDQARVLKDFCRSIGITPIKFHSLRACFAVQMLLSGSSLITVQSLLGHSSVKSMIPYIRIAGVDIANATDEIQIELPKSQKSQTDNVVNLFS
ncbi:site-specific integrase [bacterium]|nr:site-specific integrase [bacterium]